MRISRSRTGLSALVSPVCLPQAAVPVVIGLILATLIWSYGLQSIAVSLHPSSELKVLAETQLVPAEQRSRRRRPAGSTCDMGKESLSTSIQRNGRLDEPYRDSGWCAHPATLPERFRPSCRPQWVAIRLSYR